MTVFIDCHVTFFCNYALVMQCSGNIFSLVTGVKVTNKEKAVVKKQKDVVCMLHSTYDTLCIVHILSTIYCIVHTLYYILCTVYYILCTVYYILCTAYCFILYNTSIYYTLHTI